MQSKFYPYLAFDNAKTAIAYYQKVFGATDVYRLSPKPEQAKTFGLPADADLDNLTMHGGFTVLGVKVECADAFGHSAKPSDQITLMIDIDSEDETSAQAADAFYQQLVDSGEVEITMPFAEQFWGGKMGQFTDKFGVHWSLHSSPWSIAYDHQNN
ncbi:glyoxalase/bleomycin resistance/extradiol dioxygenase family protein [Lactiplantibacillus sp. WILCCON 0030]|uniref:Glyoxalase/bleomycin resistance/extradiol dioxygenase family protein n=1 Tax=Lactiplantibacillus brownii TaxID=3069269 RepID=A0ABU1AB88_9LACO|nr:glyoxalase/bleomycin resistance/extradiol dioxygenase family protein [Lactiplantibacillus brownii]MDQ7938194.1 glyoxalase/bleomycin resistance/extradiol dioxygenase family protein [Lactiplantibacillus brownii]